MDGDFCPFSAPVVRVVCVEEQLSYVHRVRGVLKRSGVVLRCRGTPGPGGPIPLPQELERLEVIAEAR